MTAYHKPVLLQESIDGLITDPNGIYVDVTFGGGGHSREILGRLKKRGKLFGFDQDEDVVDNLPDDKRFQFVRHNFRFLKNFLKYFEVEKVDGILADLGVSSHDFDEAERGFSFRFDAPLDMRMNRNAKIDAKHVVNEYGEKELVQVLREYGELKNARSVCRKIMAAREIAPLNTTGQLIEAIADCTPKHLENKFLAKLFQALRIEVNNEMGVLKDFLLQAKQVLKPEGRIVVITYHSLEDRLAKNFFRAGNFEGKVEKDFYGNVHTPFELVNRKLILPTEEEIKINPRARSAKLRIAKLKA